VSIDNARQYGLNLLKIRPRSEQEFHQRLVQKGFEPQVVEALLEEFKRQGRLDDARFSLYFAQAQMALRPVGQQFIRIKLEAKGIAPEFVEQAVAAVAEKPDLDLARELAQNRKKALVALPHPIAQRRLSGFLARRGFDEEVVVRVVREVLGDSGDPTTS